MELVNAHLPTGRVTPRTAVPIESRYVDVDGIRTHYLEGGTGPAVVLLHSGEFGGCAELSWEFVAEPLARHFHVVAPDWLGFGRTDKVHDFVDSRGRRMRHLARFLGVLGIDRADFIGNSMAGGMIVQAAAAQPPLLPIRKIVLASGGGFSPDNEYRRALLEYDCTEASMRRVLHAMFHDPKWPADDAYVKRRVELSLLPGAWEATAAARLRNPTVPARAEFGQPDKTPYETIPFRTLVIAGANDKLRNPGYADEIVARMPDAILTVFENSGHCPNIEQAARFVDVVTEFLRA
jgi:pimeloyl-ACP methyl ester carboxylesterase